jgi:hypothetical protein
MGSGYRSIARRALACAALEGNRPGARSRRPCREARALPFLAHGVANQKPSRPEVTFWRGRFSERASIWIGILIGSTIGGMIPLLWGDDMLSYSSVLLSGAGALAGLWVGFKMSA